VPSQYPLADFLPFTESPPSSPGSKVRGIFLRGYNRAVTATPAFKDHFSLQSEAYRRFRPEYPATLFEWLAAQSPGRKLAIDVATGNGQAAVTLAGHFGNVIATEPSAAQLAEATAHPRVEYRCEAAESISVASGSADLLVAAQAAHWFDWPRFVGEALRVLRPGGVLAFWTYGNCLVTPAIDRLVADFFSVAVGPYWPRERRHVEEGYRDLVVSIPALDAPAFEMRTCWDAAAMLGYLDTWSAVRRCRARSGRDPLGLLVRPLSAAWGEGPRDMRWPLVVRAHRN
jgi:SAM-dependent methyltransferase